MKRSGSSSLRTGLKNTYHRIPKNQLANTERLKNLDEKYKHKFKDRFPKDIPDAKDLPTSVYHWIHVDPKAQMSVARSYSCLRKFRQAWKTLIDQHAAAGRIWPSSSPYTSLSFIIPKSDLMVLPR